MSNSVIYYPYINVPENEWFVRTLLYWDSVSSIVPAELAFNPHKLSVFMGNLVNNELVKTVIPSDYIRKKPLFSSAFIDLLDRKMGDSHFQGDLTFKNTRRIHIEKMEEIAEELVRRHIAKLYEYPYYYVEKETADIFMAYLACIIGNSRKNPMEPITDQHAQLSLFNKNFELSKQESDFISMRWSVLESILPGPTGDQFDIKKIIEFKENHSRLAQKFRLHIEKILINISTIEDENTKKRKYALFMEELDSEIEEIKAALENYWSSIRWGTVWSVIPPSVKVSAKVIMKDWQGIISHFPTLVNAILNAFRSESSIQKRILENPLSYAALAQKKL